MRIEIRRGNDQIVRLPGLRTTQIPPSYLNAATVTATLYDKTGTAVPAYTDITLTYVMDSDGVYEWLINGPAMMLPASTLYKLVITGVQESYDYRVVYDVSISD